MKLQLNYKIVPISHIYYDGLVSHSPWIFFSAHKIWGKWPNKLPFTAEIFRATSDVWMPSSHLI